MRVSKLLVTYLSSVALAKQFELFESNFTSCENHFDGNCIADELEQMDASGLLDSIQDYDGDFEFDEFDEFDGFNGQLSAADAPAAGRVNNYKKVLGYTVIGGVFSELNHFTVDRVIGACESTNGTLKGQTKCGFYAATAAFAGAFTAVGILGLTTGAISIEEIFSATAQVRSGFLGTTNKRDTAETIPAEIGSSKAAEQDCFFDSRRQVETNYWFNTGYSVRVQVQVRCFEKATKIANRDLKALFLLAMKEMIRGGYPRSQLHIRDIYSNSSAATVHVSLETNSQEVCPANLHGPTC